MCGSTTCQAAGTENGEFFGIGIGGRRKQKVKVLLGMGRIISPKVQGEQGIGRMILPKVKVYKVLAYLIYLYLRYGQPGHT